VPTDITPHLTTAHKFVLRGVAASLGLFAVLRFAWTEAHLVLPFTQMQAAIAARWFGDPASRVEATLACSGTDALALCFGAVLAYPAAWRTRLAGVAGGAVLIVGLNTIRIGTLGLVAASPTWFTALHLYVWPAVLTVAIAGYVLGWMRHADGTSHTRILNAVPQPSRRFVVLTLIFLLVFVAASPIILESARVLALAGLVARGAAAVLRVAGIPAHAEANVLWTGSGGFLVTQECIATPLIPVYLAAVCAYSATWRRLIPGVLATLPIFMALGVVRLLLVDLPGMASPLFMVHAFFQFVLGAVVVCAAAIWRDRRTAGRHALGGLLAGVAAGLLAAPLLVHLAAPASAGLADPQGAIALLPAFQVALFVALWVAASNGDGWKRFTAGVAMVVFTLAAGLLLLRVLAAYTGAAPQVRDIRGWAIAAPVLILAVVRKRRLSFPRARTRLSGRKDSASPCGWP
jgi:exosortase/archaeosortase family protein